MYQYSCMNAISEVGLQKFTDQYTKTEVKEDADALLVRSAALHDMEFSDKLAAIARAGAGVNNIPLERCAEQGIVVFNTPGANANGVKEAVIAGLLLASRDLADGINWVKAESGNEDIAKLAEKEKKNFAGSEIKGKKLGIIGLGAIGILVANTAVHLGMEVYGYDPYISVDSAWNLSREITHITDVNDIYRECDYITIHVPLLESTKKMINEEAIAEMKDGVILLNYARDLLVDEEAVVKAVQSGKIRRYMSDFPNTTTAGVKNCIVTPHLGASTSESEDNCAVMAAKQVRDYVENGNIKNSVNYPACDMGVCKAAGRVAICHRNIPKILSKLTNVCAEEGLNIEDMTNKSKGAWAYTMIDMNVSASDEVLNALKAVDGVVKVRKIK